MSFETDELKLYVRYTREGKESLTEEERLSLKESLRREGRVPKIKGLDEAIPKNGSTPVKKEATPAKIPTEAIPMLQPLKSDAVSTGFIKFLDQLEGSGSLEQFKKDYSVPEEAVAEVREAGKRGGYQIAGHVFAAGSPAALIQPPPFGSKLYDELEYTPVQDMDAPTVRKRLDAQKQQVVEKFISEAGSKVTPQELSNKLQIPLEEAEEVALIQGRILGAVAVSAAFMPYAAGVSATALTVEALAAGALAVIMEPPTRAEIERAERSSVRPEMIDSDTWARMVNGGLVSATTKLGGEALRYIGRLIRTTKAATAYRRDIKNQDWAQRQEAVARKELNEIAAQNRGKFGEFVQRERNFSTIAEHRINRPEEIVFSVDDNGAIVAEVKPEITERLRGIKLDPETARLLSENKIGTSVKDRIDWFKSTQGQRAVKSGSGDASNAWNKVKADVRKEIESINLLKRNKKLSDKESARLRELTDYQDNVIPEIDDAVTRGRDQLRYEERVYNSEKALPKILSWLESDAGKLAVEYGDEGTLAAAEAASKTAFELGDDVAVKRIKAIVESASDGLVRERAIAVDLTETTMKLSDRIRNALPSGIPTEEIESVAQVFRAVAEALKRNGKIDNAAEWLEDIGIEAGKQDVDRVAGYTRFIEGGRATIVAYKNADASTMIHELGHIVRRSLSFEDLAPLEDFVGVKRGQLNWTVAAEEKFALAFEQYLHDGKAPNKALIPIFEKIKNVMREAYRTIKGGALGKDLPDPVRKVFDDLFDYPEVTYPKLKLETPGGANTLFQKAKPAQAKEPWEMSKEEFYDEFIFRGVSSENKNARNTNWGRFEKAKKFIGKANAAFREAAGEPVVEGEKILRIARKSSIPESWRTDAEGVKSPDKWLDEYTEFFPSGSKDDILVDFELIGDQAFNPRRFIIEQAAKGGKIGEGIKDYPDLQAKYGSPGGASVLPQRTPKSKLISGTVLTEKLVQAGKAPLPVRFGAKRAGKPLGEKYADIRDRFFENWTDRVKALKRMEDDIGDDLPYVRARLSTKTDAQTDNMIRHGIFAPDGTKLANGIMEILGAVKHKYPLFVEYVVQQRGVEKALDGVEVGAPIQDMAGWIVKVERQNPEFKQLARELRKFDNMAIIEEAVNSGLKSREAGDRMLAKGEYYIPFNRVFDEVFAKDGGMFAGGGGMPFKPMTGSDRPIDDPMWHLAQNLFAVRRRANQNRRAQELLELLKKADQAKPGTLDKYMYRVTEEITVNGKTMTVPATPKYNLAKIRDKGKLTKKLRDIVGERSADEIDKLTDDELQELAKWTAPPQGSTPNSMVIYYNGNGEEWAFRNPILHRAMLGGEPASGLVKLIANSDSWILKAFQAQTKLTRATATALNVPFGAVNWGVDQITMGVYSKNGYIPFVDGVRGMFEILKRRLNLDDEVFASYLRAGGGKGAIYNEDRNLFNSVYYSLPITDRRDFLKSIVIPAKKPLEAAEAWNDFMETSTRVGDFRPGYAKAKTDRERMMAFFNSQEGTLDFSKGGNAAREFNKYAAFFNARVLGFTRFAQAMRERPVRTTLKGLGYITLPTIGIQLNILRNPKWTEAYLNKHELDRDTFYFFPYDKDDGTTGFFRAFKPRGALLVFSLPFEKLLQHIAKQRPDLLQGGESVPYGEPTRELKKMARNPLTSVAFRELFSFGIEGVESIVPDLARPVLEVAVNHDFWRNAPVEPYYSRKNYLGAERINPRTSTLAQDIAAWQGKMFPSDILDMSPIQIEQFIKGHFTGYGSAVLKYADMMAYTLGDRAVPPDPWWSKGGWKKATPVLSRFVRDEEVAFNQAIVSRHYEKASKFVKHYNSFMTTAGYQRKDGDWIYRREPTEDDIMRLNSILKNNEEALLGVTGIVKTGSDGNVTKESMITAARISRERAKMFNEIEKTMSEARANLQPIFTNRTPEGENIPKSVLDTSFTPEKKTEYGLSVVRPVLEMLKQFEYMEVQAKRLAREMENK